jgi:hypothetical protein
MEHKLITGGWQYLPFARSRIKALRATGLRYASQQFEIDGSHIKVRLEGDHEYISIDGGGVYMESGVLDLHNTYAASIEAYKPAVVRFTPFVSSLKPIIGDPVYSGGGRKLSDGGLSWSAAGCKPADRLLSVDVLSPGGTELHFGPLVPDGESNQSADGEFCDPSKILDKKRLMASIPSSMYTGKMKLFVQALYGSARTDYRAAGLSAPGYIELGTAVTDEYVPILPGYPTTGIFTIPGKTVDQNEYLFVDIGVEAITYRTTKATPVTTKPGDPALKEAYRLSTLVPSGTSRACASLTGVITADQFPLAHGWHFNSSGSEASIVLLKEVTIDCGGGTTIGGFKLRHYVATFTYDAQNKSLSASVSLVQEGEHIPYVQSRVFYPNYTANRMDLLVPWSPPLWNGMINATAPLYCYYDAADARVFLDINNAISTSRSASDTLLDFHNPAPYFSSDIVKVGTASGKFVPSGYDVPPTGVTGYRDSADKVRFGAYVEETTTLSAGAPGMVQYLDSGAYSTSYKITTTLTDLTERCTSVCVIPAGDASAHIAGTQKLVTHNGATRGAVWLGNNVPLYSYPGYPSANPDGTFPWSTGLLLFGLFPDTSSPQALALFANMPPLPAPSVATSDLYLHAAGVKTKLSTGQGQYQGLFNAAGVAAPYYEYLMTVKTSYSGAMLRMQCEPGNDPPSVGGNGWPAQAVSAFSSAVGYA